MSNWAWYDWLGMLLFVLPMILTFAGGALLATLEVLSPFWYLVLKEKRKARIQAAKQMAKE